MNTHYAYSNKLFFEKFKEVNEFNHILHNFIVTANQINIDESLVNIYINYDSYLRQILTKFKLCEENNSDNKKINQCVTNFTDEFNKLRSDTSKKIESIPK